MITLYIATMLGWGTAGAASAEILQYYYIRQQCRQFDLRKAGIIVVATGIGTLLYYVYVENQPAAPLQAMHYGIFLALTIEEFLDFIHRILTSPEPSGEPTGNSPMGGALCGALCSGTLILNGFLPVCGVGCFGGFLAELVRIRSSRKKPSDFTMSDWVLSAVFVVASGIITALHGVTNINALTALQLGAAGPLFVKRIKR